MVKLKALRISTHTPPPIATQGRPHKRQKLSVSIPETITDDSDECISLRSNLRNCLRPLFLAYTPGAEPVTTGAPSPELPAVLQAEMLHL